MTSLTYTKPSSGGFVSLSGNIPVATFTLASVTNNSTNAARPAVTAARMSADGTQLTIVYGETLQTHTRAIPVAASYAVSVDGTDNPVTGVRVANDGTEGKVVLTLQTAVTGGLAVLVSYDRTRAYSSATGGPVLDSQNAQALGFKNIAVGNLGPPAAPEAPTVSKTDGRSLVVTWNDAESARAAVTDYDVRYRRKGDTAWTEHPHTGTARTATISGVLQGASWEAQVRATNSIGTGAWSDAGAGHTGPARFVSGRTIAGGRAVSITFTKNLASTGSPNAYKVNIDLVPRSAGQVILESGSLGPVEIHRDWMTAALAWIMAAKLLSVLQARMAMRLYSLSLPK